MNNELGKPAVRYFYIYLNANIPGVYQRDDLLKVQGFYRVINLPHTIAYFLRRYVLIGTYLEEITKEEYTLVHPGWNTLNDKKTN